MMVYGPVDTGSHKRNFTEYIFGVSSCYKVIGVFYEGYLITTPFKRLHSIPCWIRFEIPYIRPFVRGRLPITIVKATNAGSSKVGHAHISHCQTELGRRDQDSFIYLSLAREIGILDSHKHIIYTH